MACLYAEYYGDNKEMSRNNYRDGTVSNMAAAPIPTVRLKDAMDTERASPRSLQNLNAPRDTGRIRSAVWGRCCRKTGVPGIGSGGSQRIGSRMMRRFETTRGAPFRRRLPQNVDPPLAFGWISNDRS